MIVPMDKIHLIVQQKDVSSALRGLQEFGAVHVEHQEELKSESIVKLETDIARLKETHEILLAQKTIVQPKESDDLSARVDLILQRATKIRELEDVNSELEVRIKNWEEWGDFNPRDFEHLADKGFYIALAELLESEIVALPKDIVVEVISQKGKAVKCMLISEEPIDASIKTVRLPEDGLDLMKATFSRQKAEVNDLNIKLKENCRYLDHISKELSAKEDELKFQEAATGMKQDSIISILKGYCPKESSANLSDLSQKMGWGFLAEEPTEEDVVPTQLKNSEWIQLSKPALDLIEILPGYEEVDVSPIFLYFFTLFFAMLIGDAGYGTIFFLLVAFLGFKFKGKIDKTIIRAGFLFTGATILFGVLSGSYFGQAWLPDIIQPIVPWLTVSENVQWFCFTIALVHLNIARMWAAKNKFPEITFLGEIGWLAIIWGMYYLANMFVLGTDFPAFGAPLIFGGAALAFFFAQPLKEFSKKAPMNAIPFVLGVIGAGTDIISYIRLFAVGLATVAVADAANNMLMSMGGVGGFILFVVLHFLNLILALLAILVHAIRLNVLEFSGHLGLEWSGTKYNPFRMKLTN